MNMNASKGMGFPVVAPPGVGHMPGKGKNEQEAVRVFFVATTQATQRLEVGVGGWATVCSIRPMKHPAASSGVSGARAAKCGTATRLALHRLQIPPQGAGNLPTAIQIGFC